MNAARQALEYAARALGFSALGVARADADQGTQLQDWLAAGEHADMSWMERHLPARLCPERVLPGVQRVIILTYEYAREDARRARGRVARYAQGEDYHKLLAGKLADLDETLSFYGGQQRCFSDSGPVSERFFAQAAGLGWCGRHGLLIRPNRGSYCFLASILTTLELPCDTPQPARCGNCRRCEEACPTRALHEGLCDARRCLSYWSIEARGKDMPPEQAAAAGDRLYGCDICQEVCPWNRTRPEPPVDPHLLMPATLRNLTPEQMAQLDEDAFKALFAGSPLHRIGADHLRRNAARVAAARHEKD